VDAFRCKRNYGSLFGLNTSGTLQSSWTTAVGYALPNRKERVFAGSDFQRRWFERHLGDLFQTPPRTRPVRRTTPQPRRLGRGRAHSPATRSTARITSMCWDSLRTPPAEPAVSSVSRAHSRSLNRAPSLRARAERVRSGLRRRSFWAPRLAVRRAAGHDDNRRYLVVPDMVPYVDNRVEVGGWRHCPSTKSTQPRRSSFRVTKAAAISTLRSFKVQLFCRHGHRADGWQARTAEIWPVRNRRTGGKSVSDIGENGRVLLRKPQERELPRHDYLRYATAL